MKNLPGLLLALMFWTGAASAQTTVITASNLKMAGSPITVGTVSITAVNTVGSPIVFADAPGAQNGPSPFVCNVSNGAITTMVHPDGTSYGLCLVPDSANTVPANVLYNISVKNTSTGLTTSGQGYNVFGVAGVSGASWALDRYAPALVLPGASPMVSQVVSSLPNTCAGPAIYTYTGDVNGPSLYSCIGGVPVLVSSTAMGVSSGTSGLTALTGDITTSGTGTVVATLASVNGNPGTYGSATSVPIVTIDSKGRVTGVAAAPISTSAASGTLTDASTMQTFTLQIISGNLVAVPSH